MTRLIAICVYAFAIPWLLAGNYTLTRIGQRSGSSASTQPTTPILGDNGVAYWHDRGSTNSPEDGESILYFPGGVFATDGRTLSEAGDFPVGVPMDAQNGKLLVQGRYFEPVLPQGFAMHNTLTEYPGPTRLLYPFSSFPDGIPSSSNIQITTGFYDADGTIVFFFRQVQSPNIVFTALGRLSSGTVTVLARSGVTPMPGVTNTFTKIGRHSTRGNVTIFYGEGNSKRGVYQINGGTITKVFEAGDPIPSGGAGTLFFLDESAITLANEGTDLAVAISGTGGAVYKRVGGVWSRVVKQGDPIPSGIGNFFTVYSPSIQNGKVMFFGGRDNQFSPPLQLGLYVETSFGLRPVADLNSNFDGLSVRYLTVPVTGGRYWDGDKVVFNVANQGLNERALYLGTPPLQVDAFDFNGTGGTPRLTFQSQSNVTYQVLQSTNFSQWSVVTNVIGDGTVKVVENLPSGEVERFFRLAIP